MRNFFIQFLVPFDFHSLWKMLFHSPRHFSSKRIERMGNHFYMKDFCFKTNSILDKKYICFQITLTPSTNKMRLVREFRVFHMLHSTMTWTNGMVLLRQCSSLEKYLFRYDISSGELKIDRNLSMSDICQWKKNHINLQAKSTVVIFLIVWIDWMNLIFEKRKYLSLINNYNYHQKINRLTRI